MSKRKPMSFGMIVGLSLGGFVLFIAVGIFAVKAMYGQKGPQPQARTPITRQPEKPQENVDAVGDHLQMETLMAARTAEANASAQREIVERMLASYQDQILPQLQAMQAESDGLRETLARVEQRLQVLEGGSGVQIIKPERPPRRNTTGRAQSATAPDGAVDVSTTGYTVQAVVGPRAWVTSASGDHSVTSGDRLPPVATPRAPVQPDNRLESSTRR